MNNLVSIIVPAYNSEKYLEKCINSVIKQTYENIEVIIVNDGSTDNTLKIAKLFSTDERVIIIDKTNGGLSDARNCGISAMHGEFVFFLDSDDWLDDDTIEFLYNKIVEFDLGYSSISTYDTNETSDEVVVVNRMKDRIFSDVEAVKDILSDREFTFDAAQAKLYKSSIFKNIFFEKGRIFEDTLSFFKIAHEAKKMGYFNVPKYHYLIREGSLTHSGYNNKSKDQVLAYLDNLSFVSENYPEASKLLEHNIYSAAAANLMKLVILGKEKENIADYEFYKQCLKRYKPVFSKKRVFIYIFYVLYKISSNLAVYLVKLMRNRISKILEIKL